MQFEKVPTDTSILIPVFDPLRSCCWLSRSCSADPSLPVNPPLLAIRGHRAARSTCLMLQSRRTYSLREKKMKTNVFACSTAVIAAAPNFKNLLLSVCLFVHISVVDSKMFFRNTSKQPCSVLSVCLFVHISVVDSKIFFRNTSAGIFLFFQVYLFGLCTRSCYVCVLFRSSDGSSTFVTTG